MRIFVDGDGSPVKLETVKIANKFGIPVTIVTSVDHYTTKDYGAEMVYVDKGSDLADYKIVALTQAGDIVITQDYGLASLLLAKQVTVLHHLGTQYTSENIDQLLEQRFFSSKLRKAGHHTKGPKAYTEQDRLNFSRQLEELLTKQVSS